MKALIASELELWALNEADTIFPDHNVETTGLGLGQGERTYTNPSKKKKNRRRKRVSWEEGGVWRDGDDTYVCVYKSHLFD